MFGQVITVSARVILIGVSSTSMTLRQICLWDALSVHQQLGGALTGHPSPKGALSVQLDAEAVERLDRIWPGPGEAPHAYAW